MGTVVTVVILIGIAALAIYALRHTLRIAAGKDSCCGGGGSAKPAPSRRRGGRRKAAPADTDPAHYPHLTQLTVRGMTCERCAARVEGSLNALPGTWATVDLASRIATVRTKEPAVVRQLEEAVEQAGYSVIRL